MSESAKKSLVIFIYSVLILSTLLVFWQVHNFDFVHYDDNDYVFENPHVLHGLSHDGIIWAFTTGYASNWHPLTWLSHMLDCQLFGPDPGWMHLINVLLHISNTLLLFAVLKKMTGALWPSAFVAAAFALHPMHVESVAWIAERKDVLSTFFMLLTLAAYVGYVRRPSIFRYLITLALFAFGLMAKPMLVTLPFVLLLLDHWPLNRFEPQSRKSAPIGNRSEILQRTIIEKIPFFFLAVASSVITFVVQRSGGAVIDMTALPLTYRVFNTFLSYARYTGNMFWPQDLAVFYPFDVRTINAWQAVLCALLLAGVSLLAIRFWRTRKYLPIGWFWFVGTLLPVIGLVQVGDQAYADRYTYIPYIGLFIMIAWGLPELFSKLPQRKMVLGIAAAMALTALGVSAHKQVGYWNNSAVLFSHAVEVTQNNYIAHYNLGFAYDATGRYQEAIDSYKQAIRIRPDYVEAHNSLGVTYCKLGRWQDAMGDFNEALRIDPNHARSHNNRGGAYVRLGRFTEAIEDFNRAIKIDPDYAEAYNNLGVAYNDQGRWQDAIDAYKQAIRINPDYAEAYYNLGLAYGNLGLGADAIGAYRLAIRLRPDDAEARNGLAWLIATHPEIKNRDTSEAISLARGVCELANYKDPRFLCTLAAAYASAGRFSEAVDTANKALSLANASNQPQLRNAIQHHLSFYTQGKPYIESALKPLPDSGKPK
jgi:tetratricopeptide (TPR) repeat protein